jgi:trimeric autotransporter adhesin
MISSKLVMKNTIKVIFSIFLTLTLAPKVAAQTTNNQKDNLTDLPTAGFDIRGRYTTNGAGSDTPYIGIEGFLPIFQNPGQSVTFIQGRVSWFENSYQNWNVLLGQRFANTTNKEIWGGYVAFDTRQTSNKTYQQLGLGIERLGDDWDARINGYLPISGGSQLISESIGNWGFWKNFYARPIERRFQGALAGVDIEAGTRIARLGEGDLKLYGGLLYYTGEGTDPVFGARARLQARPTDNLLVGLTIQQDPLFDTSIILDLGLGFSAGGNRSRKPDILARMGEYVNRNPIITIGNFTRSEYAPATNPRTGKPWQFRHVNLGIGNGDGTFERPTGTVQEALNVTQTDDIVYVNSGRNPGVPAFRIPDTVSVLSTALIQEIDTVEIGRVSLPGSGTGIFPIVNGTVTMGNDTTLRGFDLRNITGSGIQASSVRNVNILDNRITNVTEQGISLNGVTGNNLVARNTITGTGGQGIFVQAFGNTQQQVTFNQNSVSNSGSQGIFALTSGNAQQQINGTDNTVTGARSAGIFFQGSGNSRQTVVMENAEVSSTTKNSEGQGGQGIFISASGGATQNVTLNNTRTSDNAGQALFSEANGDPQNPTIQTTQNLTFNQLLVLRGNGQGVFLQANGNSRQDFLLDRPTVSNIARDSVGEGGQGIFVAANDGAQQSFTINNPTVSDNAAQGIFVQTDNNTRQRFTINNPTASNNTNQGIFIRSGRGVQQEFEVNQATVSGTKKGTSPIAGEPDVGGQGIFIATGEGAQQRFTLNSPTVSDNAGQGIFIAVNDDPNSQANQSQQTFTVTNPTVTRSASQGFFIQANGNVRQQFEITNGRVSDITQDNGQGGQGIFIQANAGAQQSYTIDRTNVSNTAGQGFFAQSNGSATSRYTISNSSITNTANNNVFLQSNENGRMIGNYQFNSLQQNTTLPAFTAATNSNRGICLAFSGNNSNTGYRLEANRGTFQTVINPNNIGTFSQLLQGGNFDSLPVCP